VIAIERVGARFLFADLSAPAGHRTSRLLAHGDSWFDYPPVNRPGLTARYRNHGHTVVDIAVARSTLNDEAYGPVCSFKSQSSLSKKMRRIAKFKWPGKNPRPIIVSRTLLVKNIHQKP
jgi:hypothetical protein